MTWPCVVLAVVVVFGVLYVLFVSWGASLEEAESQDEDKWLGT